MNLRYLFYNAIFNKVPYHIRFISCWSCGQDFKLDSNLFCSNCNSLQKPEENKNYFNIMGLQESYDIDDTELAKKYKELQKYLHPDKFANKNKTEQEISEKYSSLVNEAYKTLQEPLARGIYMLKLRGKDIPENTEIDEEFLMEIMEKNEEVENAETQDEIMKLNEENKSVLKVLQNQISKAFFDGDLVQLVKLLSRMKYYTSIDNQIQAVIRNKGIIR
ncbi:hypothetical protein ACJJTC_001495 [Scirpophaga incertulas]